jgi:hypothetical protein
VVYRTLLSFSFKAIAKFGKFSPSHRVIFVVVGEPDGHQIIEAPTDLAPDSAKMANYTRPASYHGFGIDSHCTDLTHIFEGATG